MAASVSSSVVSARDGSSSLLHAGQRRIVIDTYLPYNTGGTEALVQLAIAFHSVYPNTFIWRKAIHRHFLTEYNQSLNSIRTSPGKDALGNLTAGDIMIVPDLRHWCIGKDEGIQRKFNDYGVQLINYLLGIQRAGSMLEPREPSQARCSFISHDFWLSNASRSAQLP